MADWGHLPENVARMVDLLTTWLNFEYASWTADPDEVEAERRKRKRAKHKPPPSPLIRPVASRPPSLHDQLEDLYVADVIKYQPDFGDTGPRMVTLDDFDAALDRLMSA